MSPAPDFPWPTQTPAPPPPKRRRIHRLAPRQSTFFQQVEDAKKLCFNSPNDVISCFPSSNTVYAQHEWATFVWNSRLPEFTQTDSVNIYLFNGDSRQQLLMLANQTNPRTQAGSVPVQVNDTWWGADGANWSGSNISHTYYWVVKRSDQPLDGSEFTQSHFTAIQTTFADSIIASMSSASVSSASAASASSASVRSSQITASPTAPPAGVQNGDGSSSFPKWAIAVIVILGFFAIATTCILIFFIMRRLRRRREIEAHRNSMGSSSPMMANAHNNEPQSPLLASHDHRDLPSSVGHGGGYAGAAAAGGVAAGAGLGRAPSLVSPDGASTISRAGSAGEGGPFSGADAAIMADAFRKALRKPDFAGGPPEEGESPDAAENPEAKSELLNRELAEEGRDIRSVSSSRGVRVETLSDSGDTIQDTPR
ncbi:hypothetical protein V5O48_000876 [Marasmius crinis-equi]|uniref:Uncharacterized protein n=1 Tax=Marasmius crinis-equi TaxID=585013 RepID=A0ABR3G0M7_9AGAR